MPAYFGLSSNSFLRSASVEYLIGDRYWIHLNHTYTSPRFTKNPPKRMNGSIHNVTTAVPTDALETAHPTKNPIEVAQSTSKIRVTAKIKNLSASAVRPTAKYTAQDNKNGKMNWKGISIKDFEVKYVKTPYILLAYSLKKTGRSTKNMSSTENKAVMI